jgi:hypothetical protein
MSIAEFKRSLEIIRAGRTDEEMLNERLTAHPRPEDMIITKFGDPRPRLLPDNRIITDSDALREVADLTDEQAMVWLDIPEIEQ